MRTNTLIVFEGIDGSGKATQAKMLVDRLRKQGHQVKLMQTPNYQKPIGKVVRDALSGKYGDFKNLSPFLSAMPYLLDFATQKEELVESLKTGFVVFDRYVPSTIAFHGAKVDGAVRSNFIKLVESLMFEELGLPKAHRVIYLKLPVELAKDHMDEDGRMLDQHERDQEYQKKVADLYNKRAKDKAWRTVDCKKGESAKDIHERVWDALSAA
jgi:dTMP kinase